MPFPSPEQVRPGVDVSTLKERFGDPTLAATMVNDGHLLETYVYTQNRSETVIRLGDGRVTSSYSLPLVLTTPRLLSKAP